MEVATNSLAVGATGEPPVGSQNALAWNLLDPRFPGGALPFVQAREAPVRFPEWVPIADDRYAHQATVVTDFWSRLTQIELESKLSVSVAASADRVKRPVRSCIDERDPRSQALLTEPVRALAPILHSIIASKAARAALPIRGVYFGVESDEEEDSRQLVVIFEINANAAQTLAFWSSLDYEVDHWIEQLNPSEQEIVTNRLGLRFTWDGAWKG